MSQTEGRYPEDEALGERLRQRYGIDGTMGDAQDIPHPYVIGVTLGGCVICGMSMAYRIHTRGGTG